MELVIIVALTVLTYPVVVFTEGVPKIILGFIILLVFPGYTLMAALFPGRESMKGIERMGFTFVMSFALVSLSGLALNYTPWGIRLIPIFVTMSILIFLFSGVGIYRRYRLPEVKRFIFRVNFTMPRWVNTNKLDKILTVVLILAIIGTAYTLAYILAKPRAEEAFTNFYILGPEGMVENYPHELVLGEQAKILLGIENHENQILSYDIGVTLDGNEIQTLGPITLDEEEEWSDEIAITPRKAGEDQKIEFLLYKSENPSPYLILRLWLDVRE